MCFRKINFKIVSCLLLSMLMFASCTKEHLEVAKVMVNSYAGSAVLIQDNEPNFSWQLKSEEGVKYQGAYRIRVSQSLSFDDKSIVWDTQRVDEQQSVRVPYKGESLVAGKTYYWQVRVWDKQNNKSAWSAAQSFIVPLSANDWNDAQWIGYRQLADSMRVSEGKNGYGKASKGVVEERAVVPLFRKEFKMDKKLQSATLFITGLGQYEASVNGTKVSDAIFTPSWSNYDETVYYNAYDVTELIERGNNVLSAIVGNGFQYINRERYRKLLIAYAFPRLICKLQLSYADGSEQCVVSDDTWKTHPSPITFSSIYGGEDYDARLNLPAWDKVNYDDSKWQNAIPISTKVGELKADINNPERVMEAFNPIDVITINDSTTLFDFGQNASAKLAFNLLGSKGDVVRFYPSEILNEDGRVTQKGSGSPYYYEYTLLGGKEESFEAKFSYYGFRYVEARGVNAEVNRKDLPMITGIVSQHVRNSSSQVGTFHSSNELFNKIYNLINWSIKSNYQSVMTDCPTREKLGWLEQTHLMGPSVHYNFDVYHVYKKLLEDMEVAQTPEGLIPSIVPEYINFGYYDEAYSDSPEWGSASIMLPYLLNKWYADEDVISKHWAMMNKYMDYLAGKSSNYILSHGLGDWYDIGPNSPGYAQLTSVPLVATATYYSDAVVMAEMAKTIGDIEKHNYYTQLAHAIKASFNAKFYNEADGTYENGSQTALAMPLALGLVEKENETKLLENLIKSIEVAGVVHTTGEVGFPRLLEALTQHGKADLIYRMNNRDDVPGYGYQIKKGATALTESWQALPHPSQNHFMIGHLMGWLYSGLGGINQQEKSVGYKHLLIQPRAVNGLEHVRVTFNTPYGEVLSSWENTEDEFSLKVRIPINSDALVILPFEGDAELTNAKSEALEVEIKDGAYYLLAGTYHFRIKKIK